MGLGPSYGLVRPVAAESRFQLGFRANGSRPWYSSITMTMKLMGALLLAATVSGCGDYQHRDECTVYVDPAGLTADELDVVVGAVDEWNDALDGVVEMHAVIGTPPAGATFPHVIRVATPDEVQSHPERAGGTLQHITVTLSIDKIWNGVAEPMMELKHTTLHELGHHLGLDHSPHQDSLMVAMPPDAEHEVTCIPLQDITSICEQFAGQCEGHDVHSTCEE